MLKKLLILFLSLVSVSVMRAAPQIINGNTPGFIKKATDLGPVDPNTTITPTVWLKLHNEAQLDSLVQQQHQKGSSSYHKWITQDQFNASFGPTTQEVNSVQNFLASQGLKVVSVAENNMYVSIQGTVGAVQKAFHVQLDKYKLNGATYRSNKGNPSVDNAHIAAITGLDNLGFEPTIARPADAEGKASPFVPLSKVAPSGLFFEGQAFRPAETHTFTGNGHTATYNGNRYGADITNTALGHLPPQGYSPSEVRKAYGLNAIYNAGYTGAGQTIVIIDAYGSSTIANDAAVFSAIYGLPPVNLQIVRAPGISNNPFGVSRGWDGETTLDVEWAHAIAPGAKIALLVATDRSSLDQAINYAVVHHLGNTISNSWGLDELYGNPNQFARLNRVLQMAAAQGIDVNFSTGDYGDESVVVGIPSVQFPASSPFATAIGGTSLALNADNSIKFQTGWGTNETLIVNPSPSLGAVADDGPPVVPPLNFGFIFGAGGGASHIFPQPAFQRGFVPPGNRMTPDIGWLADPFTGVEIIETVDGELSVGVIGGTSLACPMFSGLMAIAAQKAGHGLGQAATLVYGLPAGAVTDVIPVGSPTNVTGVIDGSPISADALAAPLYNTTTYYSALYNSPFSTRWFVLTFGTDTSLKTDFAWDNVTGVGTPHGLNFLNAIAP